VARGNLARSYWACCVIQLSALPPKTCESRMAMSGEMPRLPLTSSESLVRVTPRAFAAPRDGETERLNALAKNNTAGVRRILHRHGETSLEQLACRQVADEAAVGGQES